MAVAGVRAGRKDAMETGFALSEIDTVTPHPARIYDALLGGKDNYAAGRQAVRQLLEAAPEARDSPRANRAFLQRAVRFLAGEAGIRQFLDTGSGTCASYCVPFKRLCEHGGAFAAGLFVSGGKGMAQPRMGPRRAVRCPLTVSSPLHMPATVCPIGAWSKESGITSKPSMRALALLRSATSASSSSSSSVTLRRA
jgi:S-adenosyl methyltransferase